MTSTLPQTVDGVVPLGANFTADPYSLYSALRTERPVTRARMPLGPTFWLLTRYEDVRAALADPRLVKDAAGLVEVVRRVTGVTAVGTNANLDLHDHMLYADPPRHTRLRKLVTRAFTGRAIAALRPRIEALATELAETIAIRLATGESSVDLVEAFAFPLPMTVICEILGVPEDQRAEFGTWSHEILAPTSPQRHAAASVAMADYLKELVAAKRAEPGADILSEALATDENGDCLSDVEATSMASLLLVAGHETTVNLIGNGMLALFGDPEQFARLRADRTLLPGAIEEFLRLDSPVNVTTMRFTEEPVTIGGNEIPAGQIVLLAIGSANRDPEVFARPDDLDVARKRGHSLAFGHGIHYCLGAALARLEGEIAFNALLDELPALTLAVDPDTLAWHGSILLRGLVRLPVCRQD